MLVNSLLTVTAVTALVIPRVLVPVVNQEISSIPIESKLADDNGVFFTEVQRSNNIPKGPLANKINAMAEEPKTEVSVSATAGAAASPSGPAGSWKTESAAPAAAEAGAAASENISEKKVNVSEEVKSDDKPKPSPSRFWPIATAQKKQETEQVRKAEGEKAQQVPEDTIDSRISKLWANAEANASKNKPPPKKEEEKPQVPKAKTDGHLSKFLAHAEANASKGKPAATEKKQEPEQVEKAEGEKAQEVPESNTDSRISKLWANAEANASKSQPVAAEKPAAEKPAVPEDKPDAHHSAFHESSSLTANPGKQTAGGDKKQAEQVPNVKTDKHHSAFQESSVITTTPKNKAGFKDKAEKKPAQVPNVKTDGHHSAGQKAKVPQDRAEGPVNKFSDGGCLEALGKGALNARNEKSGEQSATDKPTVPQMRPDAHRSGLALSNNKKPGRLAWEVVKPSSPNLNTDAEQEQKEKSNSNDDDRHVGPILGGEGDKVRVVGGEEEVELEERGGRAHQAIKRSVELAERHLSEAEEKAILIGAGFTMVLMSILSIFGVFYIKQLIKRRVWRQ